MLGVGGTRYSWLGLIVFAVLASGTGCALVRPGRYTDAANDLAVYVFVPDLGVWLPAGDEVDTAAHTVAASTEHLSEWMLAITDPAGLRYEQQFTEALRRTTGGKIAGLMYGEPQNLTCDANRLLVAAAVKSDLILPPAKLCEHILDGGGYELQWVNTTELPVVFDLPAGFAETTTDLRLNPMLQGVLRQHNHLHGGDRAARPQPHRPLRGHRRRPRHDDPRRDRLERLPHHDGAPTPGPRRS